MPIYNAGYYTICMWVKSATATPPEKTTVLAEASTSSGNPLFQFRTDWTASDSFFSVTIENQNGDVYFGNESFGNLGKSTSTTKEPFDGTWHHVAWVDSNGVAALYVDGVQDPTVFINTRLPAPTNSVPGLVLDTFSLGATVKAAVSSYFAGEIQDVAIWERNLSQTEISQVMAGDLPSTISTAGPSIYVQPVGNVNLVASLNPSWAMQVFAGGTHPRTYQWYSNNVPLTDDGATIFGSQSNILNLVGMPAGYTGSFTVTVGNSYGPSVTSQAAQVTVSAVSPLANNITNGEVSVWPLSTVNGGVTPDVVGGYDMYLASPMTATNLVPGLFGTNAMEFYDVGPLVRICSPGDALPLEQYANFTVSLWMNVPTPTANPGGSGMRFFTMGNDASTTPWLSLANCDTTSQGPLSSLRAFFRNDSGANATGGVSTFPIYNGAWHHFAYVQETVGGAIPVVLGLVYVDGVQDPLVSSCIVELPVTSQIITIGGSVRNTTTINGGTSRAGLFGTIADVGVWNRALTSNEIYAIATSGAALPLAQPTSPPLSITTFQPDFGEVASGDFSRLSWSFSSSATSATINNNNVMNLTTNGVGSLMVSNITAATNFTLVVSNSVHFTSVTNTVGVTVVKGVAPGWHILDDFANYGVGPLSTLAKRYWLDVINGGALEAVIVNPVDPTSGATNTSKFMLDIPPQGGNGEVADLPLNSLDIAPGEAGTLFARIVETNAPGSTITEQFGFGLSQAGFKSYSDIKTDSGGLARLYDDANAELAVGVDETTNETLVLMPCNLNYQQVYDVWIDVTNGGETITATYTNVNINYSVWVNREGDTGGRVLVISNAPTDQNGQPGFYGTYNPTITEFLIGCGGSASANAAIWLTDAYMSLPGYNSTVPVPWTGWPAADIPALPAPTFTYDTTTYPGEFNFTWAVGQTGPAAGVGTGGALVASPNVTGVWSVLEGPATNGLGGYNDQEVITNTGNQFYMIWQ